MSASRSDPVPDGAHAPELVHVFDLSVIVGTPHEIGEMGSGQRRVIDILGGIVEGPRLRGRILSGGADYQIIRANGLTELHARYTIELDGGGRVYVENTGLRFGPPDALERLRRGQPVDPALIYFRTVPRFETNVPELAWMMQHIFLASGVRRPDRVELEVFQVL